MLRVSARDTANFAGWPFRYPARVVPTTVPRCASYPPLLLAFTTVLQVVIYLGLQGVVPERTAPSRTSFPTPDPRFGTTSSTSHPAERSALAASSA